MDKRKLIFIFFILGAYRFFGQNPAYPEIQYKEAIRKADSSYVLTDFWALSPRVCVQKYRASELLYKAASAIRPSENYPKERLIEIGRSIINAEKIDTVALRYSYFRLYHKRGDSLVARKEFAGALRYYRKADSSSAADYAKQRFQYSQEAEAIKPLDSAVRFITLIQQADKLLEIYFDTEVRDEPHFKYTKEAIPEATLYPAQRMYRQAKAIKQNSRLVELRLIEAVPYTYLAEDLDPVLNDTNGVVIRRPGDPKSTLLSPEELREVNTLFLQCLFENKNALFPFNRYKRQYFPSVNEKGEKIVWVNCFPSNWDWGGSKWKKEVIMVYDGGRSFFNVKINLKTKKYFDLMINGEG